MREAAAPSPRFIAVLDIGKTNAKVVLHDIASGKDVISRSLPNAARQDGPYPHADTEQLFDFALASLADIAREAPIDAISITSHGACAALVRQDRLALPILDYEYEGPDETAEAYDRRRPAFAETFSPRLPVGLNLGAQIFWQQQCFPKEFEQTTAILTYPQYWAWRLSGVFASEATSLGCHTDLWAPMTGDFSSLVERQGWRPLFPPLRRAADALGPLLPALARKIDLAQPVPVHCGIHDSNASLLPHLLDEVAPFSVVSTGTWVICFAVNGSLQHLDPARDTLANVDAFGRPVPSARFMGGREFALLKERHPDWQTSTPFAVGDISALLERQVMLLPNIIPGSGPFPHRSMQWRNDVDASSSARQMAAALYLALMTETCLGLISAAGPIMIEGPFAANVAYCEILATLTGREVKRCIGTTGTSSGAALLAAGAIKRPQPHWPAIDPTKTGIDQRLLQAYAAAWRAAAAS
ncbi:MAG TPA: FGGY family carbohydrate kinase [Terriglobales bacterium]|nr:FGGY family carbohydrate kinase [Terriglobales bacterium]